MERAGIGNEYQEKLPEGAESALQFAGKELRLTDYPAFYEEMYKLKTPVLPK